MNVKKLVIDAVYYGNSRKEYNFIAELSSHCPNFKIRIHPFSKPEDLVARLKSGSVDIVYLSLQEASTREQAQAFRTQFSALPTLIVGNKKSENYCHALLEHGFQNYILKEITSALELNHMIQESFRSFRYADLRNMLQKLKNTESSLWKVISESRDAVVIVDKNNFILYANHAAKNIFPEAAKVHPNQEFEFDLRTDRQFQKEIVLHDSKNMFVDFQITPIKWDDNEVLLATIRDISARVELERRKDEFLNTVSHELRTPLAVIRESISQVCEGLHGDLNAKQNKMLGLGVQSIDRLTKMINELLDISKIEANKFNLNIWHGNLSELIREVAEEFKSIAFAKNLDIEISLPEDDFFAYFDRDAILQVINNILGNAIKFTAEGKVKLGIDFSEDEFRISVADSGPGMNETDLKKLFNRFQQVGKKKTSKGSGLGLNIAKGLVDLHGGKIIVSSQPGAGSEFLICIPRKQTKEVLNEYLSQRAVAGEVAGIFIPLRATNDLSENATLRKLIELQNRLDPHIGRELCASLRSPDGIYGFFAEQSPAALDNFIIELEKEIPEAKDFELILSAQAS